MPDRMVESGPECFLIICFQYWWWCCSIYWCWILRPSPSSSWSVIIKLCPARTYIYIFKQVANKILINTDININMFFLFEAGNCVSSFPVLQGIKRNASFSSTRAKLLWQKFYNMMSFVLNIIFLIDYGITLLYIGNKYSTKQNVLNYLL